MKQRNIGVFVRAVILRNNRLLVCKHRGASWYFLPGGEVEFGESAIRALKREIKEELNTSAKIGKFIGAAENSFRENNRRYQEINLVFAAVLSKISVRSAEKHLRFEWLDRAALSRARLLPPAIKTSLLKWLKDKRMFWASGAGK